MKTHKLTFKTEIKEADLELYDNGSPAIEWFEFDFDHYECTVEWRLQFKEGTDGIQDLRLVLERIEININYPYAAYSNPRDEDDPCIENREFKRTIVDFEKWDIIDTEQPDLYGDFYPYSLAIDIYHKTITFTN